MKNFKVNLLKRAFVRFYKMSSVLKVRVDIIAWQFSFFQPTKARVVISKNVLMK